MVARTLDRKIFNVLEAELTTNLNLVFRPGTRRYRLLDGLKRIQALGVDCVFPALHGEFGEDGRLQSILETLKIPFVGSGSVASLKAMDKGISHALFLRAGFRVPETLIVKSKEDMIGVERLLNKRRTVVIKPLNGGSSVGVLITKDHKKIMRRLNQDLKKHRAVVVQEFIAGREFTCGIIEKPNHENLPLVPTEIRPKKSAFFDYKAKYDINGSEEITPPDLPMKTIRELQALALCAHELLGCSGLSRTDFILSHKRLYILETNTLPGMTKTSLLPQGAAACGIEFRELLTILIRTARAK